MKHLTILIALPVLLAACQPEESPSDTDRRNADSTVLNIDSAWIDDMHVSF